MKQQLRMAALLATAFVGLSLAFFSPGVFSRGVKYYSRPLTKTNATRQVRASRGGATVSPEFDYASALNKPLRWDAKKQPRFSFTHADQQAPVQQAKLAPDVAVMVGPVSQDLDLRDLPYIPVTEQEEAEVRLMRHPPQAGQVPGVPDPVRPYKAPSVAPNMPSPLQTFAGMNSNLGCNGCLPPDTDGDVGPNHYVQAVNSSIRIHDKSGNVLAGPITFNSFFSAMGTATPCGSNVNQGDGIVFYDHISDRWVISDFAFPAFPGTSFYQCIGVSKTSDPVSGGYWLYAVQVDPTNTNFIGDYPKFGLWPDAYYLSVNLFSNNTTFNGVRVFALDRSQMINGGPANTIAFSILPADLGDQYSLVPASFRFGSNPPAGQPEWFMDVNSSAVAGTVENQVFVRRFHADFVTPASSTFGVGATHTPDGIITVNGFVDAFDATSGTAIVPNGTATTTQYLDTLGDKLMYPLIYQNLGGVESIWSSHTVNNNQGGTGPTAIRWYQFNMTGNTIPAAPVQQQSFNNGGDGLWRWMPSINVDAQGNVSIGYSTSSATVEPGIRYAGRLAGDALNDMAQGEAVMTPGTGHQTSTSARWGDYSSMFVDPSNGCTFFHTNEFYSATSGAAWNTRVGSFKFPTCSATPLPTPPAGATPTPTATPTPPVSAGPVVVTATAGTVGPTDYPTVKGAFDAINAGTHQGAINIFVIGDTTEAAPAVLNASGSGAALYTSIIMTPQGVRTVSGAIAAGSPLIDLNGSDNVTIDGVNAGGNSLTISNTTVSATANTSTIRFINGAQNNFVKNCSVLGSSTVTVGATAGGTILFSTSPAVGTTIVGNNNNTISGNNIGPAGVNLPVKAITGLGTTTNNNTVNRDDIIDNNNIFDFFGTGGVSVTGIDLRTGNLNWTISNNRIYQTAPRTFTTTALRYAGITLSGTTGVNGNFHTIRNNTIGFGAANGTGTTTITGSSNEVRGLDLPAASSGTATSVQGNIISGINQTSSRASTTAASSPFIAISLGTTSGVFDVGNVTGNQVGSLDGSSTIVINATSTTASNAPIIGIYDFSLSSGNVSNNQIGAITIASGGTGTTVGFRGILVNTSSAATETINNNIIGGPTIAGAITDTQVGSYVMYGIQTALPAVTIVGNTIRNLVGNSNFPATVVGSGITVNVSTATTNTSLISQNVIHSLSNASGAAQTSIYAMDLTLPATTNIAVDANVIERNFIHSISNTSTDNTSQIWGIVQRGSGTAGVPVRAIVKNNMIRLGIDASGAPITAGLSIIGIRDIQGATGGAGTTVVNYYFNSVYIGGSGVVSSSSTFAFNGSALTSTRTYENNIFWNARSNASGAGKNYAISVAGTAPNPAGLTSNFNDLFANGTGGFVGLFNGIDQTALSDWQTATGQDANSISADAKFVAKDAAAATVNLHILPGSPCQLAATAIAGITNDFDNDPRPTIKGDIGADQLTSPSAAPATISGQVTTIDGAPLAGVTVLMTGARTARAITDVSGHYRFANVDTENFYTVTPALVNYHFAPSERSFSLLTNMSNAVFTASRDAVLIGNAIDTPEYFVRQHYLDFLGREPDESGFNFWTDQILECGSDSACAERRTINVSAAYFLSAEFMQTGGFVDKLYRASYGHRPLYAEFMPDSRTVGQGVIVGEAGWAQRLSNNQQAFLAAWVQRDAFRSAYDGLSNSQYVDALVGNTGVSFTATERNELVSSLSSGTTRAEVLSRIAGDERFVNAKRNEMFVMMEYFGYLRRDPDEAGYNFWLQKLNQFGGNFEQAEMVKSFIVSGEYRDRFR
jgi:uncharacterized protein DUF4214